jgi:hypothetical protein
MDDDKNEKENYCTKHFFSKRKMSYISEYKSSAMAATSPQSPRDQYLNNREGKRNSFTTNILTSRFSSYDSPPGPATLTSTHALLSRRGLRPPPSPSLPPLPPSLTRMLQLSPPSSPPFPRQIRKLLQSL